MTKHKILALVAGVTLLASCNKGAKIGGEVKLDTEEKKVSYAIGQEIGRGMKSQGIKIDVSVLASSIQHALDGKEPQLKPEEAQQAMMNMRMKMMEERKKQAETNVATGKKFLEENAKKEGIKTTDSGLQYKVVKEGKGAKPAETDTVKVHYKGTLIDGTEFDSSYSRNEPAEFPVNRVIKGWIEGLQLMPVGSKYMFYIPSDLAYGPQGRPSIPPNSVLIFEVELLDIVKEEKAK